MTVLQSLDRYYARMAARGEVDAPEFTREKISLRVVLSAEGAVRRVLDIREPGKKRLAQVLSVPAAVKRTVAILPNRMWDKTSYALGRTAGLGRRTAEEHAAFKSANLALVGSAGDPGLVAFRRFLETWDPESLDGLALAPELLDANVVFQIEGEYSDIHQGEAARRLLSRVPMEDGAGRLCLVTGIVAPVARLHPSIKGVQGAQMGGASLVSFNLGAFESYGKAQGDNAPTSEAAAARYGAALNRMLDRDSRNRLPRPLGDAAVVFWADTSDTVSEAAAQEAEDWAAAMISPPDDPGETKRLAQALALLAAGRPVAEVSPGLAAGTRFHVLGLSPNAARLSVRFWLDSTFEQVARRLADHYAALRIEPEPWRGKPPSVSRLLVHTTAVLDKFENIPPQLAGEVMRAILGGTPYPRAWLAAAVIRLRAGDDPATGWHAAAIKAVLTRHKSEEDPPVALDPEYKDPAYQLGRLFAVLEAAQREALGRGVNATVADRYYGAASATPARVFGALLRGARTHIADANKHNKGMWLNGRIEQIMGQLGPELPRTLRLEDQGRFAIGYYHERRPPPGKDKPAGTPETPSPDTPSPETPSVETR